MQLKLARGPWVDALRRYDPGLRVRWSWEKRKWCVDAPAKTMDSKLLVPPVWFERIGDSDSWVEHTLPMASDKYISYHSHRYIICWSPHVDRRLYEAIVKRDGHRMRGGFVGELNRNLHARNEAMFKEREKKSKELAYGAYDYYRFLNRKHPEMEPETTGISMKGWKEPVPSYERKENV